MSDKVEITVQVRAETPKAYLVFDGDVEAWLPKSQVEVISQEDAETITIEIPEWLAQDRELI